MPPCVTNATPCTLSHFTSAAKDEDPSSSTRGLQPADVRLLAEATGSEDRASILQEHGNHAEAEALYRQALEARTGVLGAKHPTTMLSAKSLALCLCAQGRFEEAEPMYHHACEIYTHMLGTKHPHTISSVRHLATCLTAQRIPAKDQEAESILRKAVDSSVSMLGRDHPDTILTLNNLATCLRGQVCLLVSSSTPSKGGHTKPLYPYSSKTDY